jgi:hypothetical protein
MSDEFKKWYERQFGSLLTESDGDNLEMLHKVWSLVIEHVAHTLEMSLFESTDPEDVVSMIRRMK